MSGISRLIRSATLYGYADLALSAGLNPAALLRRVGLSEAVLRQPDHPIRLDAACRLLELSSQASRMDNFGLRLAAGRRLANLGAVSVVLREEPTGMAALDTLCRFLQLVNPSLFTWVEHFEDVVLIREELLADQPIPVRQSVEMAVGVMHGILRELLGPLWRARRVCFTHRAPPELTFHRQMFACPLEFNAEFNGIVCTRQDLLVELPGRDAGLARYAQATLDKALAQARPGATDAVRQLIAVLLPQGRCTAKQVAVHLGVDRRTIHRQLALEGHSFSGLLLAVRKEFVARQLRDSDRTVTEVAQLMGFASSSAFAHWFRLQHHMSVSQWRVQALAD
ncbi:MAG: AraC family transcriptional regulator [Burkholderiaceae bacterium]